MRCYCFVFNMCEKCVPQEGGPRLTPYQARFRVEFLGPIFPFGCSVEYQPSNPNYNKSGHAVGPKTRRGISFGYHLDQGGYFKGDLLVVDEQQMENAAHPVTKMTTRIRMGEVFKVIQADGTFEFPVAFGLVVPNMPDPLYTDLDTSYNHF